MQPPTTPKQVRAFLGLVGYYRKLIKEFAKIAKRLTLLTRQQVKFDWTPEHHTTFLHLKEAIVKAPILHYPNQEEIYIVYTDASDDACGTQPSPSTQWYGISHCTPVSHLHRNPAKMEYY